MNFCVEPDVIAHALGNGQQWMAELLADDAGAFVEYLGEGIVWVLEGVGGESTDGLELADSRQPAANRGPRSSAPALQDVSHLRSPHQQQCEGEEELVAARIEEIDQVA